VRWGRTHKKPAYLNSRLQPCLMVSDEVAEVVMGISKGRPNRPIVLVFLKLWLAPTVAALVTMRALRAMHLLLKKNGGRHLERMLDTKGQLRQKRANYSRCRP